ncbi:MAG: hypothetical protein PHO70_01820 [Candidatus Omnitrophica bacterium]|nr:hypothetical protein [Candidatus Omnitrophota bacterium]
MKRIIKKFLKASKGALKKINSRLLWEWRYSLLRKPKTRKWLPLDCEKIINELKGNSFNVLEYEIDIDDFNRYKNRAEYQNYPEYHSGGKNIEKILEHYLAAKLLDLSKDDVLIDIANNNSPAPEIYQKLYGCKAYRQDLQFPRGIKGNIIGGDASCMPVNDGFCTKMSLHCSFEHFEQDTDSLFIKEASRVLAKGGKVCIVPLYLFNKYVIETDLVFLPRKGFVFESDAEVCCVKDWFCRHGRFYDINHLIDRIKNNLGDFKLTIYVVKNEKEVSPTCHVKFIGIFEKGN